MKQEQNTIKTREEMLPTILYFLAKHKEAHHKIYVETLIQYIVFSRISNEAYELNSLDFGRYVKLYNLAISITGEYPEKGVTYEVDNQDYDKYFTILKLFKTKRYTDQDIADETSISYEVIKHIRLTPYLLHRLSEKDLDCLYTFAKDKVSHMPSKESMIKIVESLLLRNDITRSFFENQTGYHNYPVLQKNPEFLKDRVRIDSIERMYLYELYLRRTVG